MRVNYQRDEDDKRKRQNHRKRELMDGGVVVWVFIYNYITNTNLWGVGLTVGYVLRQIMGMVMVMDSLRLHFCMYVSMYIVIHFYCFKFTI